LVDWGFPAESDQTTLKVSIHSYLSWHSAYKRGVWR